MRIPYNTLNEEGKRIAKRYGQYIYYLLILQALLLFVLVIYTNVAAQPKLLVIEIGMAVTSGGIAIGFIIVDRLRNRILRGYRVLGETKGRTNEQTTQ